MAETHPLLETWQISSRITLYLLDAILPAALADQLAPRAWTVGRHFAHLHENRLRWAQPYKTLNITSTRFEGNTEDRDQLRAALTTSAEVIERLLEIAIERDKVQGFKRTVTAFTGYLVAHEAYHHGEIGVILAQNGHRLDKDIAWGIWEWDKR